MEQGTRIKAIIADVGGFLARFDSLRFYKEVSNAFRVRPDRIAGLRVNGDSSELFINAFMRGEFDIAGAIDFLSSKFGVGLSVDDFIKIWRSGFCGFNSAICREIYHLRRQGLKVVSCTNVDPIYGLMFRGEREVLERLFDGEVQSWRLGRLKPEQEMYDEAARVASVSPGECLFFDDVIENVVSAREFGMKAEQNEGDVFRFRESLHRYGLA